MTQPSAVRRDLKELLTLAWPVIMSRVAIMMMGLVDVIVVGQISAKELGYLGLGWAPTGVLLMTAMGLLTGVQVMTARHIGEGRPGATGGVFRRGVIYAFWIGVASAALLFFGGPPLLQNIGLDQSLAIGASACLKILALSLPMQLVGSTCAMYLEALQRPKAAMAISWGANLVNLAMNLLLVPTMGAEGSAWATFGTRLLMCAALIWLVVGQKDARELGVFGRPTDSPRDAIEQRRIGYGGGAAYFVESGGFSALQLVAGWISLTAAASWTIVINVMSVIFMIPLGLAVATGVLVGRAYGAGDAKGVARFGYLGFVVCMAGLSLIGVVILVFAGPIARIYTADPALLALAVPGLQICSLFFVTDGLQVVGAQALRARSDIIFSTVVQVVCYGVAVGPLAWALAIGVNGGFTGIIWAAVAVSLVASIFQVGRFWRLARR